MALEAIASNEPFNFIIYDTISATPYSCQEATPTMKEVVTLSQKEQNGSRRRRSSSVTTSSVSQRGEQGMRKKRKRKPRVCKNKEEAEKQRMTHIAVERNRRKQMNELLLILRSLMPDSYAQRGDQASIVGGAIEFVKELEHLLLTLEAQKLQLQPSNNANEDSITTHANSTLVVPPILNSLLQFPECDISSLAHHQSSWSQQPSTNKFTSKNKADIADIEVTLIETRKSSNCDTKN